MVKIVCLSQMLKQYPFPSFVEELLCVGELERAQAQENTKNHPSNRQSFHFGLLSLLLTSFCGVCGNVMMLDCGGLAVLLSKLYNLFNNGAEGLCRRAAVHRFCIISNKIYFSQTRDLKAPSIETDNSDDVGRMQHK